MIIVLVNTAPPSSRTMKLFLIQLTVLLFVLYVFLALLFRKVRAYYRLCRYIKPFPGWPTHWLWGNAHQVRE